MPYPTQDDLLAAEPLLSWIDSEFLRTDPYAFSEAGFRPIIDLVTRDLEVDPNGIYCIGSGAIGLSMNPLKITGSRLKEFDRSSDLDLAVISEVHFETAWRDLRRAAQPTIEEVDALVTDHLDWQRKRFFDGAIIANKLLPALSFGREWLAAHVRLEQQASVMLDREVEVNYWIYRDYWSLRNYVASSIVQCRRKLV